MFIPHRTVTPIHRITRQRIVAISFFIVSLRAYLGNRYAMTRAVSWIRIRIALFQTNSFSAVEETLVTCRLYLRYGMGRSTSPTIWGMGFLLDNCEVSLECGGSTSLFVGLRLPSGATKQLDRSRPLSRRALSGIKPPPTKAASSRRAPKSCAGFTSPIVGGVVVRGSKG